MPILQNAVPPDCTVLLEVKKSGDWIERAGKIARQFEKAFAAMSPKTVVIEFPEVWSASSVSMAAATTGSLFKLTFLIGRLGGISESQGARVSVVSPRAWKGQMSKEVVGRRVLRALGREYPDHVLDAVGMGLWLQGCL